ncbi:PD-(D/E)XK nuclease family protein [Halarchaeum sp. CBA1220]|uniref:PD-(D/E)XK nuclease family protein n=1 Tax=Halarchaeum sp. CBA1220 TaxID=1853682 RepID=UPI000F3A9A08|nr:PD-(D/E)XK nuclease family protein [Halarchaeum sp. CBA1220]QLC34359.1 PD-(D/E)XK nuclease family protein [Halarchaeum sp. CBA1220]
MSFPRAKPVDDLYQEVAGYDLVVVPDAPLASALNRRIDKPHLGSFAITPRRLAAGRREEAEDRIAFLELVEQTDLDWKRSAYAIGNILQCWEHHGRLDAILDYDAYVDDATRQTVEHIANLETTSQRLTEYRIDDDHDVAVVGDEQLTQLERSILPDDYDTYDTFDEQEFDRPPFHIFDSSTAIIDTVVDAVTEENADDVAVVLDQGSEFSALIESAFEAEDIPFYGGPGFVDHPDHRTFVQLLRAAHGGTDTRVGEIRPLLARLDVSLDVEHDEKRLYELDDRELDWVVDFCDRIENRTFAEALDRFENRADRRLDAFRQELETLGIADTRATERAVDQLVFYLQSYEVPVDRENEGVLLADAKSAAYVDRPVVFYLGLDEDWTHSAPRRPWVDQDAQYTRNIQQFQLLLQSGATQYYLVQDAKGGSPVTPCLYFEELLDEEFERFRDLESETHTRQFDRSGGGFEKKPTDANTTEVSTISQSSLGTYVNSPRDHFFGRLVDGPDKDYFKEGNLFHDFAEFYIHHPDFVDKDVVDDVVEHILEETRPFVRSVDEATRQTKYRAGLETIVAYFDENRPVNGEFLTATSGWGTNVFAERFDRPVDSPITERWFENDELGLKGKIDLIHSRSRLIDHKSGRRKSASQVVKNSALDPPSDSPNFQALLYLTHWRSQYPDQHLEFTFFHFLETLDDVVTGDADLDDTLTTVAYYPMPFDEFARSEAFFDELVEDGANNCQKTLSQVDYEDYATVFDETALPDTTDSDELIDSAFGETLTAQMKDCVGDYKYVESGCKQAIRQLTRVRGQTFFEDDLDAFEAFVDERLAELNRRRAGEERFPVEGLGGEPNYRYVDNRDLLLEGER